MKPTCAALITITMLSAGAAVAPAYAAPPTVTPSPGYDARLQEQRATSTTFHAPVAPVTKLAPRHRKRIRTN